jgi:signal transduction histidine kinase
LILRKIAVSVPPPTDSYASRQKDDVATPAKDATVTIAELQAQLAHRNRQIEAIRRASDALFTYPGVDSIVRATLEIALDVLRADAGTVFIYNGKEDTLVARYVIGGAGEKFIGKSIPATMGIAGTVFQTHKPLLTGNVLDRGDFNPDVDKETGYHTQSMMTVPVKRTDGDPVGVMQVLNARVPFTELDLEVLQALCDQAATGIEHSHLLEEARKAELLHAIGDISHDVKNFLTPILTGSLTLKPMFEHLIHSVDAVRSRCPDNEEWGAELEKAADYVRHDYTWMFENIESAAEQLKARAAEISDAIKGEFSKPFFEPTDFNERVRSVASTLRGVAEKANVQLKLDLDPNLPFVEVDRKQIYNALYNLINNAIPYTQDGGSIIVSTHSPQSGQQTFSFAVRDTGKGMPEKIRQSILSGDPVSTTPGGTGLGTRIVLGVVRRHEGTVDIQSAPGAGTTFSVTLPLRQTHTDRPV